MQVYKELQVRDQVMGYEAIQCRTELLVNLAFYFLLSLAVACTQFATGVSNFLTPRKISSSCRWSGLASILKYLVSCCRFFCLFLFVDVCLFVFFFFFEIAFFFVCIAVEFMHVCSFS